MNFSSIPNDDIINNTIEAVASRGIKVELVNNKVEALEKLKTLIPAGATVMTAGSATLREIGFDDILIKGEQNWRNFKGELLAEKDIAKQWKMRKEATLCDYFIGSVHGIAETGEIVIASATGSQIPSYAYSSTNVIWIAGAQKITPTLESAIQRTREYTLPLEDKRIKDAGNTKGSYIGKLLIFERETPFLRRKVTLILVKEVLGF